MRREERSGGDGGRGEVGSGGRRDGCPAPGQEAAGGIGVPSGGSGAERSDAPLPEGGTPIEGEQERAASSMSGRRRRRKFSASQKRAVVEDWAASGLSAAAFGLERGIAAPLLYGWRRALERAQGGAGGGAGGDAQPGRPGRPPGRAAPVYTPEEKRAAVEAFETSGLTQSAFARVWGTTVRTLGSWLRRHREGGPKALEPKKRGRPQGTIKRPPEPLAAVIVETKRRFPSFGLVKVRDYLWRFRGLAVSPRVVARALEGADLPRPPELPRKRRIRPVQVRRFERAAPRDLWQSDITTFLLARHRQPAHLVVFLDDHSRFVVAWKLALRATSDFVLETLLLGIAKYGKPKEVLTDQGRQYFAWRGKTVFQRRLHLEGIQHVVSRAHHPATLGKTERLWETIARELWQRRLPQDLEEAVQSLEHFFRHYNFQRPHQGIGGLVPADRFFGAEMQARAAIEAGVEKNELRLALGEPPRVPVYLFGQVGDEQVSLHGERGRLIVQTPDGAQRELMLDQLGGASEARPGLAAKQAASTSEEVTEPEEEHDEHAGNGRCGEATQGGDRRAHEADGRDGADAGAGDRNEPRCGRSGASDRGCSAAAAAGAHGQEAAPLQEAAEARLSGAGALGSGDAGGEGARTPPVCGDPRVVAREIEPPDDRGAPRAPVAPRLAALAAGPLGHAGGALAAAQGAPAAGGAPPAGPEGGSAGAAPGDSRAQEEAPGVGGAERGAAGPQGDGAAEGDRAAGVIETQEARASSGGAQEDGREPDGGGSGTSAAAVSA